MKCPNCGSMQSRQRRCSRCGNPIESRPFAPDNPYAAPLVSSPHGRNATSGAFEIFRDGELIVARDGAPFPDRCVRCNQSAQGFRLKKTFYWHAQGWYLLIFVGFLIYAVVAMVVRKKASFELALCPQHRSRRELYIGLGLGLPIVAFVVMLLAGGAASSIWGFFLALLSGSVVGIAGAQILRPKRIDDGFAYLKGAHPRFLASLPAHR